jgi:hypothetical protein
MKYLKKLRVLVSGGSPKVLVDAGDVHSRWRRSGVRARASEFGARPTRVRMGFSSVSVG